MAQVKYGPLVTKIRGSIAEVTFSAARSGDIIRDRAYPRDPRSPKQIPYRACFAAAARYWTTGHNPGQRQAWNDLGDATDYYNSAGDLYHPSGINLETGANALLKFVGKPFTNIAPATARFDASQFSMCQLGFTYIGLADTTAWHATYQPTIVFRRSDPVTIGTSYFIGPWVDYEIHDWIEFEMEQCVLMFQGDLEPGTTYWFEVVGVRYEAYHYGEISYKQRFPLTTSLPA